MAGLWGRPLASLVAVLAILVAGGLILAAGSSSAIAWRRELHPQTGWAPCNRNAHTARPSTFTPMTDAAAAALVTREPETRIDNGVRYTLGGRAYPSLNAFVPSAAALEAFRHAKTSLGQSELQFNPYLRFVDGRDGLRDPSTDELIQWAAHKWGIPENWLRAQYVEESYWNGFMLGDLDPAGPSVYRRFPSQARVAPGQAYQSMGIAQVRWVPSGSVDAGTEPLRWESTAFNIDYQAAMVRFYYDDPEGARTEWGDSGYAPCEQWDSIGGWNSPYPWHNAEQARYIAAVRQWLAARQWRSSSFTGWTPPSLPPGVVLR